MSEESVNYRYVTEHIGSLFERELESEGFSEEVIEHLIGLLATHISDLEPDRGTQEVLPKISRLVMSEEAPSSRPEGKDSDAD